MSECKLRKKKLKNKDFKNFDLQKHLETLKKKLILRNFENLKKNIFTFEKFLRFELRLDFPPTLTNFKWV